MAGKFIPLNDAEKKLLSDRYLDLQFEQDIDDFVCVRCDRLAIVHFFTNCGHLLCLNCKAIIDNGGFTCQKCNTLITNASEHRDDFEKRLLALRIKCPNTKYGCQLSTNLAQIPEHVGICKFTREQALPALSTESNTMFSVLDKINEHNEQIVELKSGFEKLNEYIEASEKHKKDLMIELRGLRSDLNFEIRKQQEDSNQMKKEIAGKIQIIETNLKKLIADELKEMKEEIKLENSAIRKEISNIMEVQQKDKQLSNSQSANTKDPIEEFLKHKSSLNQLVDSFLFGSTEDKMTFESLCLKWTIMGKDIVKEEEQEEEEESHARMISLFRRAYKHLMENMFIKIISEILSDVFTVHGFQLNTQLRLTIGSCRNIRLHLCFKDEARAGHKVDLKPLPMVTYIIKDLRGQNKHCTRYAHCPFNEPLEYNQFGYSSEWISHSTWTALTSPRDASLEVLVLVEPPAIINKPLSINGNMMDAIKHYSRKLQMEKEGLIRGHCSPTFLTHADGYRVTVRMWLDRSIDENKRGLKAWIHFLSGKFDSQLGVEFEHKISVTLINQLDANKNITVKQQAKETTNHIMEIATHDVIHSGGFIVNDSLAYHVAIKSIKK